MLFAFNVTGLQFKSMRPATKEQIDKCREDFIHHYRTHLCKIKTDPLSFHSVQDFESLFTNLRVIDTSQQRELDYGDILALKIGEKQDRQARRLLAEGEAGAGKTTLCAKIAWDWLNGHGFKRFELVLIIPIRDTENNTMVGEVAQAYFSEDNTTSPEQFEKYCYENPEKVFIVLDGLDEFKGDFSKQVEDIIIKTLRSEHLLVCTILVTTRPWRADQVRSNTLLRNSYRFIRVEGFRKDNIPVYIGKFFRSDKDSADSLIRLMNENDVIAENMAPYPIYTAMLCILWRGSTTNKRQIIRRLQTFSQLFQEMVSFLTDHYFSKDIDSYTPDQLNDFHARIDRHLPEIGKTALDGLLRNELSFPEKVFCRCMEAVDTGCKVGVISREKRVAPKQQRAKVASEKLITTVLFPHKLFQEYLAGIYLASLYDSSRSEFNRLIDETVLPRAKEFQYVLYFTVLQGRNQSTNILERLLKLKNTCTATRHSKGIDTDFVVDVAFESQDEETAAIVNRHLESEDERDLTISRDEPSNSTHTVFGYLFIRKQLVSHSYLTHYSLASITDPGHWQRFLTGGAELS